MKNPLFDYDDSNLNSIIDYSDNLLNQKFSTILECKYRTFTRRKWNKLNNSIHLFSSFSPLQAIAWT